MNSVITCNPNGTGSCLYTELIDVSSLGRLEIKRASNVEFNNQTQRREVKNLQNRVLFFARSRQSCVDWEHNDL